MSQKNSRAQKRADRAVAPLTKAPATFEASGNAPSLKFVRRGKQVHVGLDCDDAASGLALLKKSLWNKR